jgi:hypothetical protein
MSQSYEMIGRKARVRSGLPVSQNGLMLYPIEMLHYEDFLSCKDAITLRISSLPAKYIVKDYFSAVYSFETDYIEKEGKSTGLFSRMIRFFELSLRIGDNKLFYENLFDYENRNGKIVITSINVTQNEKTVKITPFEFSSSIRPVLAEINGLELPDESENIDLVIANEQKAALHNKTKTLKANTDDLIASVAYLSRCRERDVLAWTVREFELRKSAIERDKRFSLYGQAEMSGMVSFKNGNPFPSWCYDVLDESLGTQSLSELNFGDAKQRQN